MARRCAFAVAAPRTSTAGCRWATSWTRRSMPASSTTSRPNSSSPRAPGTSLAAIESAMRARGQMLGFEPPHFGEGGTLGGAIASGPVRTAASLRGRGARSRARRAHPRRHRGGPVLRRPRDEERRGLRRIAPHDRRAGHARRHHRSLAQMPAAAAGRGDARVRVLRGRGDPHRQRMGRPAAARFGDLLPPRPLRARLSGAQPAVEAAIAKLRRSSSRRCGRVLGERARPDAPLLRRCRARPTCRCGGCR